MADMTSIQPGAVPEFVRDINMVWTQGDRETWHRYVEKSNEFWQEICGGVAKQIPCLGVEFIGSGDVITVTYEDKSYAWLGGADRHDFDGPWAFGSAYQVGGYRYRNEEGDCGTIFTACHMLVVPDPEDMQSIVDTLVAAARHLGTLPFTETC